MTASEKVIHYSISSPEVRHLREADGRLAAVIGHYGDLEYKVHADHFRFVVEAIIGQMLSNKVADIIIGRMDGLCGGDVSCSKVLSLGFEKIRAIGLSRSKTDSILGFAGLVSDDPGFFQELGQAPEAEVLSRLTSIRGIGNWTAKMYLIFSLDKLDVLPYEDGAFLQVYKWLYKTEEVSVKSIVKRCGPWSPYSSLAARYLYRVLDNNLMDDEKLNAMLEHNGDGSFCEHNGDGSFCVPAVF